MEVPFTLHHWASTRVHNKEKTGTVKRWIQESSVRLQSSIKGPSGWRQSGLRDVPKAKKREQTYGEGVVQNLSNRDGDNKNYFINGFEITSLESWRQRSKNDFVE